MTSIVLAIVAILLAGCAAAPALIVGPHPADPAVSVPASPYVSVTAGTEFVPVGPSSWTEQNKGVAPKLRSTR